MKTIAFYISNHGFGHIIRNIPIIRGILCESKDINIIVKCGENHIQFMKSLLEEYSSNIRYYKENTDVGLILNKGSIKVDKDSLKVQLYKFISSWNKRIDREMKFLKDNNVSLVVSDIVPWIFKACVENKVKSILISNFTWVEIYRKLFNDEIIEKAYLDSYKLADETFIYPLFGDINEYAVNPKYIGLSCREFNEKEVKEIRDKLGRPIVFVSVGRSVKLNEIVNVEKLPYMFIYTEGINLIGENTYKLPIETKNTQDFIKASDYVITKAGWSTISEAVCAKKPIIAIERKEIEEDKKTIEYLMNLGIALTIKSHEFNEKNIRRLLLEVENKRSNYLNIKDLYNNKSDIITQKLLEAVYK